MPGSDGARFLERQRMARYGIYIEKNSWMCKSTPPRIFYSVETRILVSVTTDVATLQVTEGIALFEGELQQPVAARQPQLLANVRAMRIDGARADAELPGDLAGCFTLGNVFEDFPFCDGEMRHAGLPPIQ